MIFQGFYKKVEDDINPLPLNFLYKFFKNKLRFAVSLIVF